MFFKKQKKEEIVEENQMVEVNNSAFVESIKVPDLKQYLIDGYNEIREIKEENDALKLELDIKTTQSDTYKIKYEASLIALEEFKIRDEENKERISDLNDRIKNKNNEISKLNEIITDFKIREKEILKKEKEFNKESERIKSIAIKDFKKEIIDLIQNTKGNISKNKICELIKDLGE